MFHVFVFGEASGADALSKPAINLSTSDAFDCAVKLLKYDGEAKDPDGVRMEFGNQYLLNMLGA